MATGRHRGGSRAIPPDPLALQEELAAIRALLVEHVAQGHDMAGRLAAAIVRVDRLIAAVTSPPSARS